MSDDLFRGFSDEVTFLGMMKSAAVKKSKEEADYTDMSTKSNKCSGCEHFSGGTCSVVAGKISPAGWCKYWTAGRRNVTLRRSVSTSFAKKMMKDRAGNGTDEAPNGQSTDKPSAGGSFDSHGGDNN